jgi:hypothetical protein
VGGVEQVECWIELADLVQDADFRASVRRLAEYQAAERADGDRTGLHHEVTDHVRNRVAAAVAAGIQPDSAQAAPVVADLVARYASTFAVTDSGVYRAKLRASAVDKPTTLRRLVACGCPADLGRPVHVPAGRRQFAASPSTGFVWVAAQRSTGPFEDLVRALHLPPQEQDGEQVRAAAFVLPVLVALTDSSDRTIVPALPSSVCRTPFPDLWSALDALTWVEIAHCSPPGEVAR